MSQAFSTRAFGKLSDDGVLRLPETSGYEFSAMCNLLRKWICNCAAHVYIVPV